MQETPFTIEYQNLIQRSQESIWFTKIKQLCEKYVNNSNYLYGYRTISGLEQSCCDCLIVVGKNLSTKFYVDIVAIINIKTQKLMNSVVLGQKLKYRSIEPAFYNHIDPVPSALQPYW
jgi:hypothetical protein